MDTHWQSRGATTHVLRLRLRLLAPPPPPGAGRRSGRARGHSPTYTQCGRHRVDTVCSIAGSATIRLAGGVLPARICWSLPGGNSVPDRRVRDVSPGRGEPPARICWSLQGGHTVLDCWERDRSPAGGDPQARIYRRVRVTSADHIDRHVRVTSASRHGHGAVTSADHVRVR